jgi:hypothetical protein
MRTYWIRSISPGNGNLLIQPRRPLIHGRVAVSAGTVGNSAGQIVFPDTGGAKDDHGLGFLDPVACGESDEQRFVQRTGVLKSIFSMPGVVSKLGGSKHDLYRFKYGPCREHQSAYTKAGELMMDFMSKR